MDTSAEAFIIACFDELKLSQRFTPYVQQAEQAGYPRVAKIFRALVAAETAREALMRKGLPNHANEDGDFYVCPHCGLIYAHGLPDKCVADETPGATFIVIQ